MLNRISIDFEKELRNNLPPEVFPTISDKYLTEPRGKFNGTSWLVVAPENTDQVSYVMAKSNAERVGIIPYGGGTGLVGGQVFDLHPAPVEAPIILSLERMTSIRQVSPDENVITVDSGIVLADVRTIAAGLDRLFPLSLGSEGSAQIGGLLATNAGGVNVLRYGMARDLVLGIEAVMADGKVFHGLSRLRKDNTGYDLRHLLIGSEGTLGIITAASLKLVSRPKFGITGLFAIKHPAAALELLNVAIEAFDNNISAFELISGQALDFVAKVFPALTQPWSKSPSWSVLVQLDFSEVVGNERHIEKLHKIWAGMILDGVIAKSLNDSKNLWKLREAIPLANRRIGAICSFDISLPLTELHDFVELMTAELQSIAPFRINCFGHVGDGNLHFNVFPAVGISSQGLASDYGTKLSELVYQRVHSVGGSISAEHGIGRLKVQELEDFADKTKLELMRSIKDTLDPKGILNPGAVFKAYN